jgi:hypothetical protein
MTSDVKGDAVQPMILDDMRSWTELQHSFYSLRQYQDATLECRTQCGDETWEIRGHSADNNGIFESLSAIAGAKVKSIPSAAAWNGVLQEQDDKTRWFRCLRVHARSYRANVMSVTHSADPEMSIGQIPSVFTASAALCVKMESLGTVARTELVGLSASPRYAGPQEQWMAAQMALAGSDPDVRRAVTEGIGAVEGLARIVAGNPKLTLGDAMGELRRKGRLDAKLSQAVEKIYAYASDVGGLRHGAATEIFVKPIEGQFAVDVCAAALVLLLNLDVPGADPA